jgi:hypothetical protein
MGDQERSLEMSERSGSGAGYERDSVQAKNKSGETPALGQSTRVPVEMAKGGAKR